MKQNRRVTKTEDATFKIIMVGKSAVGKSSLLTRYTKDVFQNEYNVTIGVEFATKIIKIDQNFNVKMTIWDTAGQESFKSIVKTYYKNSSAVILVYDITNKDSFLSLDGWLSEAKENANQSFIVVLIGTHKDLQDSRKVTKEQAEAWVKANGVQLYFETSAKTSENVKIAFEEVGKQLFQARMRKTKASLSSAQVQSLVNLQESKESKKGCCQ